MNRLWGGGGQRLKWAVSLRFTQVSNSAVVQGRGDVDCCTVIVVVKVMRSDLILDIF